MLRNLLRTLVFALVLVACGDGRLSPQGGSITGVTAGNGTTGGGFSGNVTVNVVAAVGGGLSVLADSIGITPCSVSGQVPQWDGDSFECATPAGNFDGTLTGGRSVRSVDANTLGDGAFVDDGTNASIAGTLGVNTTAPISPFHVSDGNTPVAALDAGDSVTVSSQTGNDGLQLLVANNTATTRPVLSMSRARGTLGSPTLAVSGDNILGIIGQVYDGGALLNTASIETYADGTVSAGVAPQRIELKTGTTNSRTTRMTIESDGDITMTQTLGVTGQVSAGNVFSGEVEALVTSGAAGVVIGTSTKSWTLYPNGNDLLLHEYTGTQGGGGGSTRATFSAGGAVSFPGQLVTGQSTIGPTLSGTPAATFITGSANGFTGGVSIDRASNDANAANLYFYKTRNTDPNVQTTVQNGDVIGNTSYFVTDGTTIQQNARIRAVVNGAVSAGVVPTDIVFQTSATNTAGLTTACTITSAQAMNCVGGLTENGSPALSGTISANVVPKGSGGNLVDSGITDDGAGTITLNPSGTGTVNIGVIGDDTAISDQLGVRIAPGGTAAIYVDGSGLTYAVNAIGAVYAQGNLSTDGNLTAGNSPTLDTHTINGTFANVTSQTNGTNVSSRIGAGALAALQLAGWQDNDGDASILHNAYVAYSTTGTSTYKWAGTHGSYGSRGIAFAYDSGILFYADSVATTADSTFTPTLRMSIGPTGIVNAPGSFTENSSPVLSGTVTTNRVVKGSSGDIANTAFPIDDAAGSLTLGDNVADGVTLTGTWTETIGSSGTGASVAGWVAQYESGGDMNITLRGPTNNYKAIFFSNPTSAADGGILYDDNANSRPRGFEFRTGGNLTRYDITSSGQHFMGDAGVSSIADNVNVLTVQNTGTGQTTDQLSVVSISQLGSFDTTATAMNQFGLSVAMNATKSAGSNTLTDIAISGLAGASTTTNNIAFYANALNGTNNYSFYGVAGTLYNAGAAQIDGNTTLGNASNDIVSITGRVIHSFTGTGNLYAYDLQVTPVAATTGQVGYRSVMNGTYDATAAQRIVEGGDFTVTATRSGGANNVWNIGAVFDVTGGQINDAIFTSRGDVRLNATSGGFVAYGNTQLGDASTDRSGIGTAPDSNHAMTFSAAVGNKIALYPISGTAAYGFGIDASRLQIYSENSGSAIGLGYGDSDAFTEVMRIQGNATPTVAITAGTSTASAAETGTVLGLIQADAVNNYLTFRGVSSLSGLRFNNASGAGDGLLNYDNTNRALYYGTAATVRQYINSSGSIFVGDTANTAVSNNVDVLTIGNTGTGQTADNKLINATNTGSYDATAAARNLYGVYTSVTATRSGGANSVSQYAIFADASGAQFDYSGYFDRGLFHVGGAADFTTTLQVNGNTTLGNATTDTVLVSGDLTVNDLTTLNGNTTIGDADSDTHAMRGDFTIRDDATSLARSLVLQNRGIDSSADGFGIQWTLDSGGGSGTNAASIDVTSENSTFATTTADASMSFKVALNGTLTESLKINSGGGWTVNGTTSSAAAAAYTISSIAGAAPVWSAQDQIGYDWDTIGGSSWVTVAETTTPADTGLEFVMANGDVYAVEGLVFLGCDDAAGDARFRWTASAGQITGNGIVQGWTTSLAVNNIVDTFNGVTSSTSIDVGCPGGNVTASVPVRFAYNITKTTGGTVKFQISPAANPVGTQTAGIAPRSYIRISRHN